MIRLTVSVASEVCRVEKTRWPVSAAVRAVSMVILSRISPTIMTSGSWRSAWRRAWENSLVSKPTSRWLTSPFLSRNRYSIGSSMVRMWALRLALIWSIMAARVVLLPLPVVPVTRTIPRVSMASFSSTTGRLSSLMVRMRIGMIRKTIPTELRCWNTFTRKRPSPATPYARSESWLALNFSIWPGFMIFSRAAARSAGFTRSFSCI